MRQFGYFLVFFFTSSAVMAGQFRCNYSGNQQEMNACAIRDFKRSDHTLNKEYKRRMTPLTSEQQAVFQQEQRAWLKDRDPRCREAAKDSEGGSIWPLEFYGCLQEATIRRMGEIKKWSTKQEGLTLHSSRTR